MKRILLVGEHPYGYSGNSHMMRAILSQINTEENLVTCFVSGKIDPWTKDPYIYLPFNVIPSRDDHGDWGGESLLKILQSQSPDILVFIGIDIWRYAPYLDSIKTIQNNKKFKWMCIAPYDLPYLRPDWVSWFDKIEYPYIYSEYGVSLLKRKIDRVKYFRPPLAEVGLYRKMSEEERLDKRNSYFPVVRNDQFLFGFIGNNQIRKDPIKVIKAFEIVKKELPNSILYMHTSLTNGVYNILQTLYDLSYKNGIIKSGDLIAKKDGIFYSTSHMIDIYNCIDCLVNCSLQEGLSWTLIEAMLCGVPVIATDTTAQTELVKDMGSLVTCKSPASIPVLCEKGDSWIDAFCCKEEDLAEAMYRMATNDGISKEDCSEKGLKKGHEWIEGVSDINDVFNEICKPNEVIEVKKIPHILFVQHSAAGDVLMSTQCFKGIKEKHPNMKLVYMTQRKFIDIITGNPYIDKIIDWNENEIGRYEVVYDPHGQKILPGGWNNLDVKLADMYPYFCKVKADDMFIQEVGPRFFEDNNQPIKISNNIPEDSMFDFEKEDYIVIHTTGGQSEYRTYEHMDIVLKTINIPIIQVGGPEDKACQKATIDLRGKLTWRETAWIMKRAKAAIVIDSFPSHLAGALGTPVIVLFGPAPARVTGPIGEGKIVNLEPNKLDVCPISSNCWGNPPPGHKKCTTPCINSINPMLVRKELKKLLGEESC